VVERASRPVSTSFIATIAYILDFTGLALLSEPYKFQKPQGEGKPLYSPRSVVKTFMLQRFMRMPSERALAEESAGSSDFGRIAVSVSYAQHRLFTYILDEARGRGAFQTSSEALVEQAIT
jgi:hypothetical protein